MRGSRITGPGTGEGAITRFRSGESRLAGQGNTEAGEAPPDVPVGLGATGLADAFVGYGISRFDAETIDREVGRLAADRTPAPIAVDTIRSMTQLACARALAAATLRASARYAAGPECDGICGESDRTAVIIDLLAGAETLSREALS